MLGRLGLAFSASPHLRSTSQRRSPHCS